MSIFILLDEFLDLKRNFAIYESLNKMRGYYSNLDKKVARKDFTRKKSRRYGLQQSRREEQIKHWQTKMTHYGELQGKQREICRAMTQSLAAKQMELDGKLTEPMVKFQKTFCPQYI